MTGRPISRRRALTLGVFGTAAVAAGAVGWRADIVTRDRLVPGGVGDPFVEPERLTSAAGRLEVELRAAAGVTLAGQETMALGYNGTSPGPTLVVRPGDVLAVRLVNDLQRPTNLHTHGLRVSPGGNADNPFVRVAPGEAFDYEIAIPEDHPTGTFWYHPHAHGHVAEQVFGGLYGALVVADDGLDVEADRLLVIGDTSLTGDGRVVAGAGRAGHMSGRVGDLVLVNGQLRPTLRMRTGLHERWRVVNATSSRTLPLTAAGVDLVSVAVDGAWVPDPRRTERVVLAPGNRVDLLARATRAGSHRLVAGPHDRGGMMGGSSAEVDLAAIAVDGDTTSDDPGLPDLPPAETMDDGAVNARRDVEFGMGMGVGGMRFTIDGRTFDPERDDIEVVAGTVEEWTVQNPTPVSHPFHLHTWPFTITGTSSGDAPAASPRDVVDVPAGGWVRLRIPFTRHTGRSVFHCHILDHEDAGMMATVVTTDDA